MSLDMSGSGKMKALVLLLHIAGLCALVALVAGTDPTNQACSVKLPAGDHKADIYKNNLKWKEPTTTPAGDQVQFECPTGFLSEDIPAKTHKVKCQNGKYDGKYNLPDLLCKSDYHSKTSVKKLPNSGLKSGILHCNAAGWAVYEVSSSEKPLYRVCLDTNTMRPKFSFRLSTKELPKVYHQSREDVWGFDGYGKTAEERTRLSQGYVKKVQQRRTTQAFSDRYSGGRTYPYYFNRGHLTAYTDLAGQDDQKATVEYLNAAPQWDVLNEGSWSLVEREVRSMLKNNPESWEIYTGTYGRIQSPKGQVFLAPIFDGNKFVKGQLPIPQVFWKLAYNTQNKNLTRVFVGVNNPDFKTINDITPQYRLCYLPVKTGGKLVQGDEFKGFTYECFLDEFLAKLEAEEKIVVPGKKN